MTSSDNQIEDLAQPCYDILIIGAGVIGCSIGRELSRYRLKVLVVDKRRDVSCGASSANSGIVHGGYDERHGTVKSSVSHKGNQMFSQLQKELNFGFRVIGSLVCAFEEDEIGLLEKLLENGKKNGVDGLRIVNASEVKKLEPAISHRVKAALHCPHTGITSPYEYCIALAENACINGIQFKMLHEVVSARSTKSGYVVSCLNDGRMVEFHSTMVVNCAGLFSDKIAEMFVKKKEFEIVPRVGEYLILDRSQGKMVSHVLFPVPHPVRGKGILVSRTYWGNLLLGPTSRLVEDQVNKEAIISEIVQKATAVVPSIDARKTITSYSGSRAKSNTSDFIIEQRLPGYFNVAGIDSPGLTSSPAIAQKVIEMMRPSVEFLENHDFVSTRPTIIHMKGATFTGRIDHPDSSLNIICRCETITESEIVDAIHRPLGAQTVMAVKKRTRAGMGPCQGTFCEPRVRRILSRELRVPHEMIEGRKPGKSLLPHFRVTDEDKKLLSDIQNARFKSKV